MFAIMGGKNNRLALIITCVIVTCGQSFITTPTLQTHHHPNLQEKQQQAKNEQVLANKNLPRIILYATFDSNSKKGEWVDLTINGCQRSPPGELSFRWCVQVVPAITELGRRKSEKATAQSEILLNRFVEEYRMGNENAGLSLKLFNVAMDAQAKIGKPAGVIRVMELMKSLREENENLHFLKPDVFSMSSLVAAWAKSGSEDSIEQAVKILNFMEKNDLKPNVITYNSVMHAIAITAYGNDKDKPIRIQTLIDHMKKQGCEPDMYTYQSLILAWSKVGGNASIEKAEGVLTFLHSEAAKGNKKLEPNVHCYSAIISAWAKSSMPGRAKRAYEVLLQMRDRYEETQSIHVKPNVVVYTAVINACCQTTEKSEKDYAYNVAKLVLEELSYSDCGNPNFLTFAAYLRMCATLLPEGEHRDAEVRRVFERACQSGQVGNIVLDKLNRAASTQLKRILLGQYIRNDGSLDIPHSWTQNVKGERYGSKKLFDRINPTDGSVGASIAKSVRVERKVNDIGKQQIGHVSWNARDEWAVPGNE